MMNVKIKILLLVFVFIIGIFLYNDYRVKNARVVVKLKDDLKAEVFSDVKVSDYIEKINGKIIKDKKIDTKKIGTKNITFDFINDEGIKVSYSFDIEVIDTVEPLIGGREFLTLYKGYDGDILDNILCGDNYDDNLECKIVGDVDVNKVGVYKVTVSAIDSSNNESTRDLTVNIIENSMVEGTVSEREDYTYFSDIVNKHKDKNTKIGIDVSKWEGDIDFKKVKSEGVEFVYIRLGHQKEIGGKYIIDSKFKENLLGFQKQNIKVGVYFFSKADNKLEAERQAKWVVNKLKGEKIDLEVVFDWENWNGYNKYELSFHNLNEVSETFMNYLEKNNYKSMLYSSKYYLENVWGGIDKSVWLAHYTEETNYSGSYKVWQLCENGKIDGIEDTVDIDVMYEVW